MEIVDGVVYHTRPSTGQPNKETVMVAVDDETGVDDRAFKIPTAPGTHRVGDKVKLLINGIKATIAT